MRKPYTSLRLCLQVEAREDDITDDVEALRRKVESLRPPSQGIVLCVLCVCVYGGGAAMWHVICLLPP